MKTITALFLVVGFMLLSFIRAENVRATTMQQTDSTKVDYKKVKVMSALPMSPAQLAEWKKDKKYCDPHGIHFRVIKDTAWKQQ